MKNLELVELCRFLARINGVAQDNGDVFERGKCICAGQVVQGQQFVYVNERFIVFAAKESLGLEVVIREGVTPGGGSNPAVMVDEKGKMFRWHGEVRYIREAVFSALDDVVSAFPVS